MPPDLPPNFKLGQSRRTAGIVTQSEWNELSRDEGDAVDALSWHHLRVARERFCSVTTISDPTHSPGDGLHFSKDADLE